MRTLSLLGLLSLNIWLAVENRHLRHQLLAGYDKANHALQELLDADAILKQSDARLKQSCAQLEKLLEKREANNK